MVPKLEILDRDGIEIGDAGCAALAEAVGCGALPELKMLYLDNNEIGDAAMDQLKAACETRGIGVDIDALQDSEKPDISDVPQPRQRGLGRR